MAAPGQEQLGGRSPSQQVCRGKPGSLSASDSRPGLATPQPLNRPPDCAHHGFPGLPLEQAWF